MKFIGDLHIHSHFSRATSKKLTPEFLDYWAGIKGIKVVGTGDFTHPGWINELKEKLVPQNNGLYTLKDEYKLPPLKSENNTHFLLSAEISNIYKKDDKVRKVHNIVLVPGFKEAEKINTRLINLGGNLKSDGRPILGLDSKDLLEIVLESGDNNLFIPAHIWTPWFSMLGSKSGFDSIIECFDDLSGYITAVETGLSTDAPINWLCSFLDHVTLISNSDAHSPDKLGRNANIFNTELSYQGITEAFKTGNPDKFMGTIDLFPQEGKYHYDGHRKCNILWDPVQTISNQGICPVCNKPVTIGVMNRIIRLSDRENINERPNRLPFHSIIPLNEIIAEIHQVGTSSKKVLQEYEKIILTLGNETDILLNIPIDEIKHKTSGILSEAIHRMRNRQIIIKEGFDGEYGKIKVFNPGEINALSSGNSLFHFNKPISEPPSPRKLINFDLKGIQKLILLQENKQSYAPHSSERKTSGNLNEIQVKAVEYIQGHSIILAGPGTGKTKTLVEKIRFLISNKIVQPDQILAITFTNKAANEIRFRLSTEIENSPKTPFISTFHSFGKTILEDNTAFFNRSENFILFDEIDKYSLLKTFTGISGKKSKAIANSISTIKMDIEPENNEILRIFKEYEKSLIQLNAFDFDDLICKPVKLFEKNPEICQIYQDRYKYILIDEYQDTNKKQYELIRLLTSENKNILCVIGDPNQAIYGFRGSDVHFIKRFKDDFPTARLFELKMSYRCSQKILTASSNILNQPENNIIDSLNEGIKINISEQATDKSEAEYIAREIVKLSGGLSFFSIDSNVAEGSKDENITSLSDFAVFCRNKNLFQSIEKAFSDHSIPYQSIGYEPFYRSEPFSGIIDIYHAAIFPDNLNFIRLLKNKYGQLKNFDFKILQKNLNGISNEKGLDLIKNTFFNTTKNDEQLFEKLKDISSNFTTADEFIKSLKLGNGIDTYDQKQECVTLMTLHASKGLEFECVFIAGCEEGIIPYNIYNTKTDPEEEKRLLYVGMTRAKKMLYLSHTKSRRINNQKYTLKRSHFIDKIEKELIQKMQSDRKAKKLNDGEQLNLFGE